MTEWTNWHEQHSGRVELIPGVDCWVWVGGSGKRGYGRVRHKGRGEYAHRAAYIEAGGDFANGPVVRHICGNRLCVRPSHLKSGTKAENNKDTAEMFMTNSPLSPDCVRGIRLDYNSGMPLLEIASKYGIAWGSVYPIVSFKSFRHFDPDLAGSHKIRRPRKLTREMAAEIRRRIESGDGPQSKLATEFNVAQSVISRIYTGVRWQTP